MKKNPTNGKHSQPEQGNSDKGASQAAVEAHFPGRRAETKLEFPTGQPDLDALRSVTREWLVPLLVERFLREQGVRLRPRPNAGPGKTPISDL
jgi:hypothetical protein